MERKGQTPPLFRQVHGDKIARLDGMGIQSTPPEADAGFTREVDKPVYVFTADCLPVLLFCPHSEGPVAAIHCGWRGALQGIVRKMFTQWNHPASQTKALFGPSIGVCCFEVRHDFIAVFEAKGLPIAKYLENRGGKQYCDLLRYVREVELPSGVEIDTQYHRCTVCSEPLLPSFRRNGTADPCIRSWIQRSHRIKKPSRPGP